MEGDAQSGSPPLSKVPLGSIPSTSVATSLERKIKPSSWKTVKEKYMAEHERLLFKVFHLDSTSAMRPSFGGPADNVTCSMIVEGLADLSERTMDYSLSLSLFLEWHDKRLVHNSTEEITFHKEETIKKAWLPDIYFVNEKNGILHSIISENNALMVYPNGDIIYSMRLTLTLSCFMELNYFPMDRQTCPLVVRSYAYNDNNLILTWREKMSEDDPDAVNYNKQIEMPQFRLTNVTAVESQVALRLGNFTTLHASFTLERVMGFYIVHTFLPSFLLVVVSWITFWLHVEATAARASLGITTVLTVTTQISSSRFTLPEVSYPTALDIWFSGCLVFVFSALLEFALVNYVHLLDARGPPLRRSGTTMSYTVSGELAEMDVYRNGQDENHGSQTRLHRRMKERKADSLSSQHSIPYRVDSDMRPIRPYAKYAKNIDKICRVLFPSLFFLCNVLFWPLCLR
ncbi:glycine receptor subunit alpha-4-like [Glandiceps talaboti]